MLLYYRYSGILSAYGLALADVVEEIQEPCAALYDGEELLINTALSLSHSLSLSPESSYSFLDDRIHSLTSQCVSKLVDQGFSTDSITTTAFLNLRYDKTDCALMCTAHHEDGGVAECNHGNFRAALTKRYTVVQNA